MILYNATVFTGVTCLRDSAVVIENGHIIDVFSKKRLEQRGLEPGTKSYDLEGAYLTAGLIDTHIHGLHGHGTNDRSIPAIMAISDALVEYGVTSFCPTIYPQEDEDMLASIRAVAKAMNSERGARILGIHLEGPFINPAKHGAQRIEYMRPVDIERMEQYYIAARGNISNMTVAPELKGMRDLAHYCLNKGIVLQAGHSDASYEHMREGMEAGITHSTHFFNAMKNMHHRDPGLVGAILIHPELTCELIADGVHVHPAIIQLLIREKAADKICLVTDSIRPNGQKVSEESGIGNGGGNSCLFANNEEVYLGENNVFYRKKDNVMAGSALTLNKAVANMVEYGCSPSDALLMATLSPASILRKSEEIGNLLPGRRADLAVFDSQFKPLATLVGGEFKLKNL